MNPDAEVAPSPRPLGTSSPFAHPRREDSEGGVIRRPEWKGPSAFAHRRLRREWRTLELMVGIYCRDQHHEGLCPECQALLDYAAVRLERCRFGVEKPTCARCPVHCYQKQRRDQVRAVMRYAGPRMLWEHPVLSLRHWLDGFASRDARNLAQRR